MFADLPLYTETGNVRRAAAWDQLWHGVEFLYVPILPQWLGDPCCFRKGLLGRSLLAKAGQDVLLTLAIAFQNSITREPLPVRGRLLSTRPFRAHTPVHKVWSRELEDCSQLSRVDFIRWHVSHICWNVTEHSTMHGRLSYKDPLVSVSRVVAR